MAGDVAQQASAPRDAASVILVRARENSGEAEVFLLRRHARSGFMASSFVFPGGTVEACEQDLRETAARELLEEAGVLLSRGPVPPAAAAALRGRLRQGASFRALLDDAGIALALDALCPFAHWITPSVEPRRFSARFFVAELPAGQSPSFDDVETVDQVWVTPADALARAGELALPPPQVRTMYDLLEAARGGPPAVRALADERAPHVQPIVPRAASVDGAPGGFALLLPWDPDYVDAPGDGIEIPAGHPLARGPSRFILGDDGWQLASPPRPDP